MTTTGTTGTRTSARDASRLLIVWAVLVVLTLAQAAVTLLLRPDSLASITAEIGPLVVITVAFIKIHLIGDWFMAVRTAPRLLRRLFGGWVVLAWLVIVVLTVGVPSG